MWNFTSKEIFSNCASIFTFLGSQRRFQCYHQQSKEMAEQTTSLHRVKHVSWVSLIWYLVASYMKFVSFATLFQSITSNSCAWEVHLLMKHYFYHNAQYCQAIAWCKYPRYDYMFNPLMLTAAKTGLTILMIFFQQKHLLENIWRRNINEMSNGNSPSNTL